MSFGLSLSRERRAVDVSPCLKSVSVTIKTKLTNVTIEMCSFDVFARSGTRGGSGVGALFEIARGRLARFGDELRENGRRIGEHG